MPAVVVPLPAVVERAIRTPKQREAACEAAVQVLKSGRSLWPVDTGRSKRAWAVSGRGSRARVRNPTFYSSYVEARNGRPAAKTLSRYSSLLLAAVDIGAVRGAAVRSQHAQARLRSNLNARIDAEAATGLYERFLQLAALQGRRKLGVRETAELRRLRRRIREETTR